MSNQVQSTVTDTIPSLPADVDAGIWVGADGTIGGNWGVTLTDGKAGESMGVAMKGKCMCRAADATPTRGNQFEIDGAGKIVVLGAGTAEGRVTHRGTVAADRLIEIIID